MVQEYWTLSEEGLEIADHGSHEVRVFNVVPKEGITIPEMTKLVGPAAKFGQGAAFKAKWISKTPEGKLVRLVESVVDQTQTDLLEIKQTGHLKNDAALSGYKKRKLVLPMYSRLI